MPNTSNTTILARGHFTRSRFRNMVKPSKSIPQSLLIIQIMLCLGVVLGVFKAMVLPLKDQKPIRSEVLIKTFIKAGVYIVVGVTIIVLTFNLFVGV